MPLSGLDHPEAGNRDPAAEAATTRAPRKARTKRPRPTFDDGTLTRHFKFPSKSYPKSTYYVTATEIIIRIRKARKKWKLVIPKKRLVSYRTNRWFAKPRFVEVELTFTQASKLGLVAPRAAAAAGDNPVSDTVAPTALQMALQADRVTPDAPTFAEPPACDVDAEIDADADAASADETVFELDAESSETDADDSDMFEAELDDGLDAPGSEAADVEPGVELVQEMSEPALPLPDAELAATYDEHPVADADATDREKGFDQNGTAGAITVWEPLAIVPTAISAPLSPVTVAELAALSAMRRAPMHRSDDGRPARRRGPAAPLLTGFALLMAGVATIWLAQGNRAGFGGAEVAPCAPPAHCAAEIVTGSLKSIEPPSTPDTEPHDRPMPRRVAGVVTDPQAPPHLAPAGAEELEPEPTAPSRSPATPSSIETPAVTLTQLDVAPAPEPGPTRPDFAEPPPAPRDVADSTDACAVLPDLARALDLRFDYASASLGQAVIPALDTLASRLRSCAAAIVIIEGHADGDGDLDRNQALSVRRAQAVREHLLNAGLGPQQLWMIGFGQSRPFAPNDTADNKRRNRRAVLVVELPQRN